MTSPAIKKILAALRANHDEAVKLRLELEKHLTNGTSTRPREFDRAVAQDALEDPTRLVEAFSWNTTEQGEGFWSAQYRANALSPEGRAILEKWLAE